MICIFSPAGSLTGGTYRSLRSMLGFPRGEYMLFMPIDVKQSIADLIVRNFGRYSPLYSLVAEAEELEPLGICKGDRHCYRKYGMYLTKRAVIAGCDFLYIPHEHPYVPLGFSAVKWTMQLQVPPCFTSPRLQTRG